MKLNNITNSTKPRIMLLEAILKHLTLRDTKYPTLDNFTSAYTPATILTPIALKDIAEYKSAQTLISEAINFTTAVSGLSIVVCKSPTKYIYDIINSCVNFREVTSTVYYNAEDLSIYIHKQDTLKFFFKCNPHILGIYLYTLHIYYANMYE